MPKKVTKKLNIPVPAKKMGFWVNKENLRKGERTIKTKKDKNDKDKALVLRNRSGYEYSKTFTGYELTKAELKRQFQQRSTKAQNIDLALRAKTVDNPPVLTAKQFFDFTKRDVEGIDTPTKDEPKEKKPKKITDTATKREQELKAKIASGEIKLQERSAKEQLKDFGSEMPKPVHEYGKLNYPGNMREFDETRDYIRRNKNEILGLTDLTKEDLEKLDSGSRADQVQRYDKIRRRIWSAYYNT